MITFSTVPKPFRGPIAVIQRNAITRRAKSVPNSQVIVFGDEPGVTTAAADIGVEHVPTMKRSPSGAPLLDGVFREAQALATHDVLCFLRTQTSFSVATSRERVSWFRAGSSSSGNHSSRDARAAAVRRPGVAGTHRQ